MEFNLLLYGNKLETRPAFFLQGFNRPIEKMAIVSFGSCNLNCPYCKRDGQFKDDNNKIIKSKTVSWNTLKSLIDTAISQGKRIRLSGGDPCMYPEQSLFIAKYVMDTYKQKISIAHNGTSPKFVESLLPYLEYVAIDYKGSTPASFANRAGITIATAKKFIQSTQTVQKMCAENNTLVDVRTCVFEDTSLKELQEIGNNINNINLIKKNVYFLQFF